jgi:capsular exopolysaccharide synthesis family protein
MQLSQILNPLKKWWWLLLAAGLVAAATSYVVALYQPAVFRAHTTLMVGRSISDPNPSSSQLEVDRQLAETYTELATQELITKATAKALGLPELPKFDVKTIPNSQLIDIGVVDNNPQRAMIVANELANQLINNSPSGPQKDEQERQQFVNQQLGYFQQQIQSTQSQLNQLQQQLGNMTSARLIQDTQTQIKAQQDKLSALQSTYATLLEGANSRAQNIISVLVPAETPKIPVGPNKLLIAILAGLSGIALAAAAAYYMEFISNTIRSSEEVGQIFQAPIIGYIPVVHGKSMGLFSVESPFSAFAESFRMLRTNLEFTRPDNSMKTILISSAGISDGKSTVATNLAVMMAQAHKKVILLGADLRQPAVHDLFHLPNERGLSDVLLGQAGIEEVMRTYGDPPIVVIPSGEIRENPAEILGSAKMNTILNYLRDRADFVIIDSPPFFISDTTILAARVDGVLLVARPDYTKKDALWAVREQLQRIGVKLIGVVINGIPAGYNHYSGYYSRYGYNREPKKVIDGGKSKNNRKGLKTPADQIEQKRNDGNVRSEEKNIQP